MDVKLLNTDELVELIAGTKRKSSKAVRELIRRHHSLYAKALKAVKGYNHPGITGEMWIPDYADKPMRELCKELGIDPDKARELLHPKGSTDDK